MTMPSILFINRVYPPSNGATARVLEHIAESLVLAGWRVSVLVGGTPEDQNIRDKLECRKGVMIHRLGRFGFSRRNMFLRAASYAFMIPMFMLRSLQQPKADVVVTMTDPPMLLSIGILLRYFKKSYLIHWSQDLYPEVAEAVGVLSPGGLGASFLRALSTYAMRCHNLMIVPGRCVKKRLLQRGIEASRISVIPNIGVEQKIKPLLHDQNLFRKTHGLEHKFVVAYSGNMGLAHDFETLLDAAEILQERGESNMVFLFIGSGPREKSVREQVFKRGLHHIKFLPSQPEEILSESFGAADIHLVTMKNEMLGFVVPSKFYGVLAAGRPCIFIGPKDSEVAQVINELQVGNIIAPGDAQALVAKILEYRSVPAMAEACGARAYSWINGRNDLSIFIESLTQSISGGGSDSFKGK